MLESQFAQEIVNTETDKVQGAGSGDDSGLSPVSPASDRQSC